MKTEFAFKPLKLETRSICTAPVAAAVRKSAKNWINLRLDKATVKATGFKPGVIVSTFIDEANRALLFLSDQRPPLPGSRKVYGKDHTVCFELPRKEILHAWFPIAPMKPMTLVEASHGRLVIQVPR